MTQEHKHHIVPIKVYLLVFVALMVLLVLTIVASNLTSGLGIPILHVGVAITIAVIKAVLIMLYFMHVRYSPRLIWVAAGASFFWLGIMFVLTLSDYSSRTWLNIIGK